MIASAPFDIPSRLSASVFSLPRVRPPPASIYNITKFATCEAERYTTFDKLKKVEEGTYEDTVVQGLAMTPVEQTADVQILGRERFIAKPIHIMFSTSII